MPEGKKTSLYARCPICSQVFYKTSINKHIRVKHHGQKPYSCDICKKQFVAKCNLVNHMWQHKNQRQRPFKCTQCKKAYLREALLEQHMRSHRGVKPFVCNECGLQFTVKSNWQRHVAEHSGTRNYECEHCHKRFSRSYYLTDHLKVHTGEKPYICGICGKTAATRSNYNSHLRTHITREPVNSEVWSFIAIKTSHNCLRLSIWSHKTNPQQLIVIFSNWLWYNCNSSVKLCKALNQLYHSKTLSTLFAFVVISPFVK
jgi:uncharacterized Zn-finger protein